MANQIVEKFKNKKALSRLKSQDKEAFIEAYDENVDDIHRFVYFKIGSKEEANDLTSMIFLKTWNHIQTNSLEDSKTLRALLYKIARNTIIDYYRETSNKITASLDDEDNKIEVIDEKIDPQTRIDQEADLERIKSKLPLLKEEYREVIIMRFINDLTLEEIADISGKKIGNIRVLIHRALSALKTLVEADNKATDNKANDKL
ncbi:RNA polymerase sigma factor [Candidatus Falkowbacteria bacterium]|jgi:RNA polymerase sigma-70 factor (ECF subfamily)|nr:RNA polymerase sigma factor [Candidatus Falkowbacteria bacterium]